LFGFADFNKIVFWCIMMKGTNPIGLIIDKSLNELAFPQDFVNKIICGDCRKLITKIPDKSIDAIITDPPYGLSKKDIMNDNDLSVFYEILPECYRVLKDDSFFITFFSTKHLPELFKQNPFTYFWQIVLYCPEGRVNSPIGFTKYMSCFVFTKGSPKIVQRAKDIFVDTPGKMVEPDEGYIDHPTPKPKHFIKELLKMFTKEGELILDPFVGSGSVSLACYQMNRNFVAFEIKKEYCLLAYQRLENSFKPQLKWQDTLWSK